MKPRFCIIDDSIAFTGAFKSALLEAELFRDEYDFIFVVPNKSTTIPLLKAKGFTVYSLPMLEISRSLKIFLYPFRLLQNAYSLKKILIKEKVQILQVNDFYNLSGAIAKSLGFKGKLLTYVRFLPATRPYPLRNFWIAIAQKYSHKVIAVSDAVLNQLPQRSNTIRIYNAIDLKESYTERVGISRKEIVFLYLANYIRGKGQEYALQAFNKARRQNPEIVLKFVGSDMGLTKNKNFKKELQQYVIANDLEDKVFFESFEFDIERLIKDADVVLNFSEAESFSLTCAEAAFYGRPVIATRCGGPEEIVVDKQTGLLVRNKNIEDMANAILTLASLESLRKTYSINAKVYVRNKFSSENFIKQFTRSLER